MKPGLFKEYSEPTEPILKLLDETVLGSNGARYRHCDTREHVLQIDNPLYLCVERNSNLLCNVTFCKRGNAWYLRYFAFDKKWQGSGEQSKNKNGFLKDQVRDYFNLALENRTLNEFYAYIDPNNTRSLQMANQFGFSQKGFLYTQTFSRFFPKIHPKAKQVQCNDEIIDFVRLHFGQLPLYFENPCKQSGYITIKENKEIIALLRLHKAHWEWIRLPGKMGKVLIKILPYIPLFRRLFNPKNNHFLAVDSVFVKDNNALLMQNLFESALNFQSKNQLIWWAHSGNDLYNTAHTKVNWGLLHNMNGRHEVTVMKLSNNATELTDKEMFVSGLDLI